MQAKTVFDSQGKGALIGGVSVALQVGDAMYIGCVPGRSAGKAPVEEVTAP